MTSFGFSKVTRHTQDWSKPQEALDKVERAVAARESRERDDAVEDAWLKEQLMQSVVQRQAPTAPTAGSGEASKQRARSTKSGGSQDGSRKSTSASSKGRRESRVGSDGKGKRDSRSGKARI